MSNKWLKSSLCLAAFTLFSVSLILLARIFIYDNYIKDNQRVRLEKQLSEMLPGIRYNNNLASSCYLYKHPELTSNEEFRIYVAEKNDRIVGYVAEHMTLQGYGGAIKLLTGLKPNGEIVKVAVIKHNETPGLGDNVLPSKGNWLEQFVGASLSNKNFAVKKDGGDFTYTTGATITPRAIVNAEKNLLDFYKQHNNTFNLKDSCNR